MLGIEAKIIVNVRTKSTVFGAHTLQLAFVPSFCVDGPPVRVHT